MCMYIYIRLKQTVLFFVIFQAYSNIFYFACRWRVVRTTVCSSQRLEKCLPVDGELMGRQVKFFLFVLILFSLLE